MRTCHSLGCKALSFLFGRHVLIDIQISDHPAIQSTYNSLCLDHLDLVTQLVCSVRDSRHQGYHELSGHRVLYREEER